MTTQRGVNQRLTTSASQTIKSNPSIETKRTKMLIRPWTSKKIAVKVLNSNLSKLYWTKRLIIRRVQLRLQLRQQSKKWLITHASRAVPPQILRERSPPSLSKPLRKIRRQLTQTHKAKSTYNLNSRTAPPSNGLRVNNHRFGHKRR